MSPETKVTALATREPMDLLAVAVEKGADVQTIERLVALAERVQAIKAKAAFDDALVAFQFDCESITKESQGQAGRATFKYAPLPAMMKMAKPHLKKHGFSIRWKAVSCAAGSIGSECILTHVAGHSESSGPFVVPISTFAGPSGAQHAGAADTYTERYTFKKVTGITPDDSDADDAASANGIDIATGEVRDEPRSAAPPAVRPGTVPPPRVCPLCNEPAIIKGRAEYGGGWLCYKAKGGCGEKYKDGDTRLFAPIATQIDEPGSGDVPF